MLSVKGLSKVPGKDQIEVRVVIPADVRESLVLPPELAEGRRGKGEFKRIVPNSEAGMIEGAAMRAAVKEAISRARGKAGGRLRPILSQRDFNTAFSDWSWDADELDPLWWSSVVGEFTPSALCEPDAWLTHPAFERIVLDAFRASGRYVSPESTYIQALKEMYSRASFSMILSQVFRRQWARHCDQLPVTRVALPQGETITAVLERALAANPHAEARQFRNYVRRLTESIGDIPVTQVTKTMMTDFRIALQQFPVLKSGKIKDTLTFPEIIDLYAETDDDQEAEDGEGPLKRIIGKTIRTKWFAAYKYLFDFAVQHDMIARSPVIMPLKKWDGSSGRRHFEQEEIAQLFSHDLYPREGAAYWLPILGLWTGMRLSEIGGIKIADIKVMDRIEVIDLQHRKLKTRHSQRIVPLPKRLTAFRKYVEAMGQRGEIWLFPDLPEGNTAAISKTLGRLLDDCGLDDPALCFHSFRHTWKRGARNRIEEEVSDLISGHKGLGGVGREYGAGMDLHPLSEAMERIDWPTFPL